MLRVEGIGWVILLCREDVRLGMATGSPLASLLTGRCSPPVRGRTNEDWVLRDGARSDGDIVYFFSFFPSDWGEGFPVKGGVVQTTADDSSKGERRRWKRAGGYKQAMVVSLRE